MKIARREEAQRIDDLCAKKLGLTSKILMSRAADAIARQIQLWPGLKKSTKIVFLCGPGKNGGDGELAAAILKSASFQNIRIQNFPEDFSKPLDFSDAELFVDGLFGVGLNRNLEGPWLELLQKINLLKRPVIAIDLPSGLDANRGVLLGEALRCRWTLSCGLPKPGLFLQKGPSRSGRIFLMDLGIPSEVSAKEAKSTRLLGHSSARRLLPARETTANKSQFGRLLIIGGNAGMEGAAILAATAAARIGTGYVEWASPADSSSFLRLADFLTKPWKQIEEGDWGKASAILIGPGLGLGPHILPLLKKLKNSKLPVLVDADALTICAQEKIWPLPGNWVLTPHAGELSRILNQPSKDLEDDRLQSARKAVKKTGAVVLFKGLHSVVDNGRISYIINSGNVALAKAGTGDVLSGFIGGLLAQGLDADQAAALGAYLHGAIADEWVQRGYGNQTLMASDLPRLLRKIWQKLTA